MRTFHFIVKHAKVAFKNDCKLTKQLLVELNLKKHEASKIH